MTNLFENIYLKNAGFIAFGQCSNQWWQSTQIVEHRNKKLDKNDLNVPLAVMKAVEFSSITLSFNKQHRTRVIIIFTYLVGTMNYRWFWRIELNLFMRFSLIVISPVCSTKFLNNIYNVSLLSKPRLSPFAAFVNLSSKLFFCWNCLFYLPYISKPVLSYRYFWLQFMQLTRTDVLAYRKIISAVIL